MGSLSPTLISYPAGVRCSSCPLIAPSTSLPFVRALSLDPHHSATPFSLPNNSIISMASDITFLSKTLLCMYTRYLLFVLQIDSLLSPSREYQKRSLAFWLCVRKTTPSLSCLDDHKSLKLSSTCSLSSPASHQSLAQTLKWPSTTPMLE